jgi:putative transposase
MPRNPRASQGGYCYHVLNRGNGRRTIFHKEGDFASLVQLLRQAGERTPVRLLAYCPTISTWSSDRAPMAT